jgi:hypothetical protein
MEIIAKSVKKASKLTESALERGIFYLARREEVNPERRPALYSARYGVTCHTPPRRECAALLQHSLFHRFDNHPNAPGVFVDPDSITAPKARCFITMSASLNNPVSFVGAIH